MCKESNEYSFVGVPHHVRTVNDCAKVLTSEGLKKIRWWRVVPRSVFVKTSTLILSNYVAVSDINLDYDVAAAGLTKGAVAVCDIHK